MKKVLYLILISILCFNCNNKKIWTATTQQEWVFNIQKNEEINIKNGFIYPKKDTVLFQTKLKTFSKKQQLQSISLKQRPNWNNWKAIPKITPKEAEDAPVFIPVSNKNYWLLARYTGDFKNGYHSWHSTDMKNWKHYGPVTSGINRWVTSAEHVNGKFYIYFDKPNDEDPHLVIDEDLTDGKQGKEIGMVFNDPTHGSDMAIFRDDDSTFHLIYEDWSPINPRLHSWDSPLAGHADSPDGIHGFEPHEFPPPIDQRSKPTGIVKPYKPHPNQLIKGKDLSPYNYEIHEGAQDAFGDYTMIKVGDEYYIFSDYDPHEEGKSMRIGSFRSNNITKEFQWNGEIGEGFHPDPTIGFAEGKFYLLVQRNDIDFISDGPWVDGVEVRVGIDTNNNGEIDKWTDFKYLKEKYKQKEGFVKVIETIPATMLFPNLEKGYGFKIEFRLRKKNGVYPILGSFKALFN